MKKFITNFLLCCMLQGFALNTNAKPFIITSITPLASLVKMLSLDEAIVEAVQTTSGCPHHLQLRPSQVEKIKQADLTIYIDDKFETALTKYFSLAKTSFKLSNFPNFKLINNNWHLWLDIDNAIVFLQLIKPELVKLGLAQEQLEQNYQLAVTQLNQLKHQLSSIASKDLNKLLIVSDSLRYLFSPSLVEDFYITGEMSLKRYRQLADKLTSANLKLCVLASNTQNPKLLTNLFKEQQLVLVAGENWPLTGTSLDKLYLQSMAGIIEQIQSCLANNR